MGLLKALVFVSLAVIGGILLAGMVVFGATGLSFIMQEKADDIQGYEDNPKKESGK